MGLSLSADFVSLDRVAARTRNAGGCDAVDALIYAALSVTRTDGDEGVVAMEIWHAK